MKSELRTIEGFSKTFENTGNFCTGGSSRPSVIHSITLINNALSRTNLCHTETGLLKSLTAEVPIFLLFQVIIFFPHSTGGSHALLCLTSHECGSSGV